MLPRRKVKARNNMDRTKIDLDAPAFEEMPATEPEDEKPADNKVDEEVTTTPAVNAGEPEKKDDPERVPYSRFEKVYRDAETLRAEAEQAKRDAEYYRGIAEARSQQTHNISSEDVPSWWIELYGDSEQSRKGYELRQKELHEAEERAEQRALKAIEEYQYKEQEKLSQNEELIDSRLHILSEYIGRQLTEDEQSAVLDIVDDYTPKDEDGKYAGEMIPFDKAWEIYEMRQAQNTLKASGSRNNVASLSGAPSTGEPKKQEDEFVPGKWGSWRNRKI